ncbi:alkene reductase [Desulfogranum japonicum]|uniref:alkene reductase n=1 Tax=Desulfogranum japonicum TaxID=231447 RepID=UPI0003FEE4A0|nr:alkene reductase [Desulfogranum japonicum]
MAHTQNNNPLLTSFQLGPLTLPNRVVMAPLTRMRASMPGNVPQPLNAEYYRQRATAGLIIAEATPVSPMGYGYYATPGIHTKEQAKGWLPVTQAVHDTGGRIFLQLWHVGRQSHPDLLPGNAQPVAPSALSSGSFAVTAEGVKEHPLPRALETAEIPAIVEEFRIGSQLALEAGFDGVEIHGANGYLLEQFTCDGSNIRNDQYGGSLENRLRFPLEVTKAVASVWGADRVGYRMSPSGMFGGMEESNRLRTFSTLATELNKLNICYLHIVEPRVMGNEDLEEPNTDLTSGKFRPYFNQAIISAGGHDRASGIQWLENNECDLVAYGRHYISNPDLVERFAQNVALTPYDRETFYGGDHRGYTDYPFLNQED